MERHVWHLFVIRVDNREKFRRYLADKGVQTGVYYPSSVHLQKAYLSCRDLTITEEQSGHWYGLPVFPELTNDEIGHVVQTIQCF